MNVKTILYAILSAAFLFAANAQTLTVGNGSATCGSTTQVAVSLDAASGVDEVRFDVNYDTSKLTALDVKSGSINGLFLAFDKDTAGKVSVIAIATSPVSGPGSVAQLDFSVASNASGSAQLSIANVQINRTNRSGQSGSLTISCSGNPPPPPPPGGAVSLGSASGACGATVEVPVSIGAGTSLESLQFTAAGGNGLTFVDAVASGSASGFLVEKNLTTGGVVMIGSSAISGPGEVARLKFALSSTASGAISVGINDVKINNAAASSASGTLTASCNNGGPIQPTQPNYVSPVNESTGIASPVVLRWQGVAGASNYRVRFGTSNPPPFHNSTDRMTLNVATQAGTTYFWSVEAIGAGGASASGPVWQFTTAGVHCVIPNAPSLMGPVTEVASGAPFSLTWSMTSGVTEYVLEESSDLSFSSVTTTRHPSASATLTLWYSNPTTRYFRVRGRNAAAPCSADGARSNTITVRIIPGSNGGSAPRILAVAGSLAGSGGSYFRTSLQLHNHSAAMMRGRVVFHRQGTSGTPNDPSFSYQLAPGVTTSWSDVVLAFGAGAGIGSIDLIAYEGDSPLTVARVYNDAGASGTTGVAIEAIEQSQALTPGRKAHLFAPIDPARSRMNIGVRSLGDGATIEFTLRDYSGNFRQVAQRSFSAHWFEQMGLNALFDKPLLGDEVIVVEVKSGSAIVYGSTTDNVTQDPAIQFAK